MEPLVSILMPSYNSEMFIGKAIESVLCSTYTNFELIITDDRSTDKTYEIAKSYSLNDDRIKVFLNEKNYGDYPNRNVAAKYAKGKYLKYVDHDDLIYPYGLELLVYYMEQYPEAGYGLCSIDQDKKMIFPFILSPYEAYHRHYFESEIFHKAPLSSIIKRDVFESVNGFTGKPLLGDFEFWHILSQKHKVLLMPHGIVWYRVHENQESRKLDTNLLARLDYFTLAKNYLEQDDCPLPKGEKIDAIQTVEKKIARFILSAAKHYSFKKAIQLKKEAKFSYAKTINKGIIKW